MGGVLSYLFGGSSYGSLDTTVDSNTGLSEKDKQILRDSWALASDKSCRKANGIELFIQLFRTYPDMQNYFQQFKGMDLDAVRASPKMGAHAMSVMYSLSSLVDNLDDLDTLVGLLEKIAKSHLDRGLRIKEFEELKVMFIPYLKSVFGPNFTKDHELAWTRFLTTLNAVYKQNEDKYINS